ncbi:hypothetical protein H0W26_01030 [Candidatus Dependentiae bacterium]|nr:hypothetical protein [Candidatus Dependentiae bacterium]
MECIMFNEGLYQVGIRYRVSILLTLLVCGFTIRGMETTNHTIEQKELNDDASLSQESSERIYITAKLITDSSQENREQSVLLWGPSEARMVTALKFLGDSYDFELKNCASFIVPAYIAAKNMLVLEQPFNEREAFECFAAFFRDEVDSFFNARGNNASRVLITASYDSVKELLQIPGISFDEIVALSLMFRNFLTNLDIRKKCLDYIHSRCPVVTLLPLDDVTDDLLFSIQYAIFID